MKLRGSPGALDQSKDRSKLPPSPPASRTASRIVERCQAGDDAAWGELVDRYSSYVYAISVRGYGLDHASAEDVFQEVFARTFEHVDQLRDDDAIRPWVGQLTRRLCIDRLRAGARVEPHEEPPDAGREDPALEHIEDAMVVHEGLTLISPDQRTVLARFFLHDESYESIGADLGLPAGTIASRISRGLTALRHELESD